MSTKVIMPQMGESIFEGTVTKWLKNVGDYVNRDEPLFEISTDKVDSEIPSPAAGTLTEILVPEGTTVQINTVVAIIGAERAEAAAGAADLAAPQPERIPIEKPAVPFALGAATTIPSAREESETVPLAEVKIPPPAQRLEEPTPEEALPPQAEIRPKIAAAAPSNLRTSPLVRRIAREHNLDLSQIPGTGLEGRITKQDILNFIDQRREAATEVRVPAAAPEPEVHVEAAAQPSAGMEVPRGAPVSEAPKAEAIPPDLSRFVGEAETVPMTPMRKAIAEHMVTSKRTSAHVSTVFEIDMTAVVRAREQYKDVFEQREGVKLTYTPFFVKALVDAVREFPILNCSVSGENIVYKKSINVGIAVALETGLIVPVVRDAHLKSFTGLALAINDLAERARTKRLKPDEVQQGTITITNPGIYGSLFGTPIINQPQVAILGVGGIEKRPVVVDDAIAIRSMVYLSLTFDHRVIDGAVADQFMARLKTRLQSWTAADCGF